LTAIRQYLILYALSISLTNTHQTTKSTGSEDNVLGLLPVWAESVLDVLQLGL
jgi:hypothetical protein